MTKEQGKQLSDDYWEARQWERFLDGEVLYDICSVPIANTLKTWLEEYAETMSRGSIEKWLSDIRRWIHLVEERKCDKILSNTYEALKEINHILLECSRILTRIWTLHAIKFTSAIEKKNEIVFSDEYINLSFWQLSSERKNKMLFFPGIQIEVAPFLQSVEVVSYSESYTEEIEAFFATAHAGYLYCFDHMSPKQEEEDETHSLVSRKSMNLSPRSRLASLRKGSKRASSTHQSNLIASIKKLNLSESPPKQRKSKPSVPSYVASPPPKKKKSKKKKTVKVEKTEEGVKAALVAESTNLWTQPAATDDAARAMLAASHLIDLKTDSLIGNVYHILSYKTFYRKKQSGGWLVHTEKQLDPFELSGEIMHVSLKVPVEEVFMGPGEPVMAFQDAKGTEWKKGVFTTHTQFDQNTFVISTKLSKFGKIALFQNNDFHFPYRKWSVEFHEKHAIFFLHSNTVALSFQLSGHTIMLETQTGDEFSKLRSLHGKKYSLQEMCIQMIRHGVYIFPNEPILAKHKTQVKNYELEIFVARHLCLNKLAAYASRMNSSLPPKEAVVNLPNKTMQVVKCGKNTYEITYGQETGGAPTGETTDDSVLLSNVFRWMLLTRALSLTK